MKFDIKKDWLKLVITLLAITTAFSLFTEILSHMWQMYILSALVIYTLWLSKMIGGR